VTRANHRRGQILDAAVDLLSESGYPGLTQPKVVQRVGITQSHLTYYFPTRSDLVGAVAEAVVSRLLEVWDSNGDPASVQELIDRIAVVISSPPRSRAILSLILAAETDLPVRAQVIRLIESLRDRAAAALAEVGPQRRKAGPAETLALDGRLLHAAWVGLAITALGEGVTTDREANRQAIARLIELLLTGTPNRRTAPGSKRPGGVKASSPTQPAGG
jgi:AcrR family transcriptional regulator